jgi:NAD(P)-dependent dehydrogenase (short-subunit alcohol dehydrogenase family)
MNRFTDKVVVVTGSGSGIGRATAIRLASEGANVACVDLDEGAAQKTAAQISGDDGQATAYHCDVSDADDVRATIAAVASDLGAPDALCNIAGIQHFAHSTEETLEGWQKIIAVNLTGTWLMSQAVLPHILGNGGNIVNTASNAGLQGLAYSAAYCASKGGVVQLTRAMAIEYWAKGIRINAVAPGGVNTALTAKAAFPDDPDPAHFTKMTTPMGMAEPEQLAALFAFVASDEASYMTGAIVSMDGGLTT